MYYCDVLIIQDNKNRRDSDTDSNRSSLLKSNVHHIVNEPGAYVPNAVSAEKP